MKFIEKEGKVKLECGDFVLFNNQLIGVVKKEKNFLKLDTYLGD